MSIKIGDFVKGTTDDYGVTNTKMTRGVVADVCDGNIVVRVLDHDDGEKSLNNNSVRQLLDGLLTVVLYSGVEQLAAH